MCVLGPAELNKGHCTFLHQEASQLPLILCTLGWCWERKDGFQLGFISEFNFKSSKMEHFQEQLLPDPCHLDVLTLIFYSNVHWLTFPSLKFTSNAD